MASKLNSCSEVALRLQTYLDGELTEPRITQIQAHLDACIDCGYEADAFRELKQELSSVAKPTESDVLDRLKQFTAQIAQEAKNDEA